MKINIILSIFLVICIIGSVYFFKNQASKKSLTVSSGYVSLRYEESNLRTGPGIEYPTIIKFKKKGIPLKIIDQHNDWYKVEDIKGNQGWIYKNITSTKKTAIIITSNTNMYFKNTTNSKVIALINKNNIVDILQCIKHTQLCKVKAYFPEFEINKKGWILRQNLWGATN